MKTLLRIGVVFILSAIISATGAIGANTASLPQDSALPATQSVALPSAETPLNPADSATTPKTDVALPSTESPLVPKGVIEEMKKQPIKEISPAAPSVREPGTGAPGVTPLTPAPAVAAQDEDKTKPTATEDTEKKAVAKKEEQVQPVGRVIWVKGIFMAEHKDKKPRKLDKQAIIFVGDTLITDAKTQAQIAFTDTTLMTFRPNTKFEIAAYSYHPEKKSESGSIGSFVMNLVEGGFRTITGLIPKGNKDDYKVKTPVATIGVRGTDYTVYVAKSKEVVLGQLAGTPTITTEAGGTQELTAENRYATINVDGSINITTVRPPALDMNLPVVPATVEPITPAEVSGAFGGSAGGGGGGEWCIL